MGYPRAKVLRMSEEGVIWGFAGKRMHAFGIGGSRVRSICGWTGELEEPPEPEEGLTEIPKCVFCKRHVAAGRREFAGWPSEKGLHGYGE